MNLQLQWTPFALAPMLAGAVTLAMAFYAWRQRRIPGVAAFAITSLGASLWSLGYVFEILSSDLQTKIAWDNFQFLGTTIVSPAFLVFVLLYTRRREWHGGSAWLWLLIEPIITTVLALTDHWHGLIRANAHLEWSGFFQALVYDYGGWLWFSVVYDYCLLSVGMFFLARHFAFSSSLSRYQAGAALLGASIPYVGGLLTVLGLLPLPVPHLDISPLTFAVGFTVIAWGTLRFHLLDMLPIVREMVIESITDGMVVLDAQNRIADLNPAAQHILGISATQALGRNAAEALRAWPDLIGAGRNGSSVRGEISVGEGAARRIYGLRLSPLRDSWNNVIGWVITLRDSTERKRAEAEVFRLNMELERRLGEQTIRARYLTLLNEMTRATLETPDLQAMLQTLAGRFGEMFDADGCLITQWDEAGKRTIPSAAAGTMRETFAQLAIEAGEKTITQSVLQTGRPLVVEDMSHTADLSPRLATLLPGRSLFSLPLTVGNQKLGAVLVSFNKSRRFTPDEIERGEQAAAQIALAVARVRLYHTLADERGRLEAIIKSARDGVILVGMDQHINMVNAPALELLRLSGQPEDWLGRPMRAALALLRQYAAPVVQITLAEMRRIQHGDELAGEGECEVQQRTLHWYSLPVQAEAEPLGRLLVLRDVTEERQLEKMRQDLTHAVVHDLRNPLTTINTALYMVTNPRISSDIQGKMLNTAQLSAKKMLGLVNSILHISRLESGQMPLECSAVKLATLAGEMIELLTPLASEKNFNLKNSVPDTLPSIWVDNEIIGRVLQNLLGNAIKFTPPGGKIEMTARPPETTASTLLWVAVSNSGPGIPPEIQDRLFQKFVTGRQEESGSGLGLAFCRLAVEAHGGRIWVESEPGQLTTFQFTLPIRRNQELR